MTSSLFTVSYQERRAMTATRLQRRALNARVE
jgi:hypothetical protein